MVSTGNADIRESLAQYRMADFEIRRRLGLIGFTDSNGGGLLHSDGEPAR